MRKRFVTLVFVLLLCSILLVLPATALVNGKIAFYSARDGNDEIFVMNGDGSGQIRLTDTPYNDNSPAWSPDGTKIAFNSDRNGNDDIYVMNADGSNPIQVTDGPNDDRDPTWSPDGTKIAFASIPDVPGAHPNIYVINTDGSNQIRLINNKYIDYMPAWSPDGTKIAFNSNRDGTDEIYVMNADGSNQIRLTDTPYNDNSPAWSPDGKKIAFVSDRTGNDDIYVMNADGSNPTQLTHSSGQSINEFPAWSPDGTKIVFDSNRDGGNAEIYVMDNDGNDQTRLTTNTDIDLQPSWGPVPITNQPPILTNPGNKTITEGKTLTFNLQANDPENGPITFSFMSDTSLNGATLVGQTFTWTPPLGSAGTYSVTFKATDIGGLYDEETIKITVNLPINVKIVPRTLNLGSKGFFLAFVTLPEAYKDATIDMNTVSCSGAPAVQMMRLKIFPRIVGFVFKTSDLKGVPFGTKIPLTVQGELKNRGKIYTFTGSDTIKVISKPSWQPDDIKDVSKVSDDQLFKKFTT